MEKDYKEIYERYIAYEEESHQKNQRKIKIGLKVNILLPMVFLIISFLTQGSKLVFLILWIVSLFGIAAYLINVEYRDYRMQERLKLFAGEENAKELEVGTLIGTPVAVVEERVNDKINVVDEKIAAVQGQMADKIREVVGRKDAAPKAKDETAAEETDPEGGDETAVDEATSKEPEADTDIKEGEDA